MLNKICRAIKKIYFDKNYNFEKKNIIFFYELGCFLQKKKLFFIADVAFSIPYFFYRILTFKRINFKKICYLYNTDKARTAFSLAKNYDRYFSEVKNKNLKILEIGIGGHSKPHLGGSSLRALKRYFRNSRVYGIDLVDKKFHGRERITILQGSQFDINFLKSIEKEHGPFDIIIDDGSHYVEHQLFTFNTLFKNLSNNGIYIIEDVQTSYRKFFGGSTDINDKKHLINIFSNYIHNVYVENILPEELNKIDNSINISSIQFFSRESRCSILIEKSGIKKSSADSEEWYKLTREELDKKYPNHKYSIKLSSGVRKYEKIK